MLDDPLYGAIVERRRRFHRMCFTGTLMIVGALIVVVSLFRQSPLLALFGIGIMATASQVLRSRGKPGADGED